MKFVPTNTNFVFEPITTPNKNIQSYFMRSEQSFLTLENFKYLAYPSTDPPIQLLITDGVFMVDGFKFDHDFILENRLNIVKYKFTQRCLDGIYSEIYDELKKVPVTSVNYTGIKTKTVPVQLIVSDFFGRSIIVSLIDIVLRQLGFKAVTVLPLSLCMSFHLNQNYCAFIYENGFSFVDDFCLIDMCDMYDMPQNEKSFPKIRLDDEDFAEEYSRLVVLDENLRFSCDECGQKEDTEEKMNAHIAKEHPEGTFFEYHRSTDFPVNFTDRMRYLFNKEKFEKISKKLYSVECNFEGSEKIENAIELAISGAQLFSSLEISKELWMTDHEWENGRLRVLKEKLLFYI